MRATTYLPVLFALSLLVVPGARADVLWSNGAVNTGFNGDNHCDSGPGVCGNTGSAYWTIFDNFNVPSGSQPWVVSGFDFTDFLVSTLTSAYQSTQWSIFNGDPLSGGKLVASGSATAVLTLGSGSAACAVGSTCRELFTITLGSPVTLSAGNTYYLGTTNTFAGSGSVSERAFAAGGNTAPGGTVNSLNRWEQSNGATTGVVGSAWTAGSVNSIFPGSIPETATAFDINGTRLSTVPEPGPATLAGMALAALWAKRRLRRG